MPDMLEQDLAPAQPQSSELHELRRALAEKEAQLQAALEAAREAQAILHASEVRQDFLLRLNDVLRPLADPIRIQFEAARVLCQHVQADRAYYSGPQNQSGTSTLGGPLAGLTSNAPSSITDTGVSHSLSAQTRVADEALGIRAFASAPVVKEGELVWTLNVVSSIARAWTQDEIALIKDVAERTWAAVERARAEVALRGSEQRFREFAAASTDILWIRNARTLQLEFVSSAFGKIYGARPQDMLGRPGLKRWIRLVDRRDRSQVLDALRRVRSGQRVMQEYRIFRQSDGQMRWIRNTGFPLLGGANTVEYIGGIAEDYTEAKEISARLQVMVTELQHRTRNQIAVVRSLSDKTLDESQSLEDYRLRYGRRLGAMARAQQLLSRLSEGQRVFFDELLRAELAGHGANPATVSLEGPAGVPLRSSTVQTLALALHELATNAVKYGALSTPGGQLRVGWHVSDNDDGTHQRLHVDWRELGVSAVQGSEAGHSGYGRELIERALPYQLNARTQYEIGPDGVHCTIDVPISGVFRAEKN